MKTDFTLLLEIIEREFRGHTFNGKSLMETLRPLSGAQAADRRSTEGYSAWDNLLHCVYFKFVTVRFLGAQAPCEPYPWKEDSFAPIEDVSDEAWQKALDYTELVHDTLVAALKELPEERLEEPFPIWDCKLRDVVIWMATHDTYHNAQVRNMGLPFLTKPRTPPKEGF